MTTTGTAAFTTNGGIQMNSPRVVGRTITSNSNVALTSDLLMGNAVTWMTPVIYGCFVAGVGLGQWLGRSRTWARTGLAALAGSVLFYVVTNFAVWVTPNGLHAGLYAHTWDGLIQCYVMALPFFRNDIAGNVLWSAMLFGLFDLMQLWIKAYRPDRYAH